MKKIDFLLSDDFSMLIAELCHESKNNGHVDYHDLS